MALYLDDFLRLRDITGKIRIVRHRDKRYDLDRLYATGEFEIYQASQTNPVFGDAEYILSFMGLAHMQARLIGLYRVLGSCAFGLNSS